jgi:hypothetical protein
MQQPQYTTDPQYMQQQHYVQQQPQYVMQSPQYVTSPPAYTSQYPPPQQQMMQQPQYLSPQQQQQQYSPQPQSPQPQQTVVISQPPPGNCPAGGKLNCACFNDAKLICKRHDWHREIEILSLLPRPSLASHSQLLHDLCCFAKLYFVQALISFMNRELT